MNAVETRTAVLFSLLALAAIVAVPPAAATTPTPSRHLNAPRKPAAYVTSTDIGLQTGFQDTQFGHLERGRALVAADFNGDGRTDFFVGNPGDDSYVLLNVANPDGSPSFQVAQVPLVGENAWAATAFDYENDGDPDLFIGEGGVEGVGYSHLFKNMWMESGQTSLSFVDVTDQAGVAGPIPFGETEPIPIAAAGVVAADYDRDGWTDIFLSVNIDSQSLPELLGRNLLWHNNGDGTFTDVTAAVGLGVTAEQTRHSTWFDYDNDGDPDLYENNYEGYNHLWQNRLVEDGYAHFVDVTAAMSPAGENLACPYQSFASAATDFNNDGWQDLMLFERWSTGEPFDCPYPSGHAVFINQGGAGFVNLAAQSLINSRFVWKKGVMGCQVGDVNGDGSPDVYIGNGAAMDATGGLNGGQFDQLYMSTQAPGQLPLFRERTPIINYAAPQDPGITYPSYPYRTHGTVITDVDGDGTQEIAVTEGGPASAPDAVREPDRLFKFTWSKPARWLIVHPIGDGNHVSTDAIGTRFAVTVTEPDASTATVRGTLFGGSCFSASNGFDVYLGLGSATAIQSLEIDWPDGTVETRTGLSMSQRMDVAYGSFAGRVEHRMGHVSTDTRELIEAFLVAHPRLSRFEYRVYPLVRGWEFYCG